MLAYVIQLGMIDTADHRMQPTRYINDSSGPSLGLPRARRQSNQSNTVVLGHYTRESRPSSRTKRAYSDDSESFHRRAYSDDSGSFHQKHMRDEFLEEIDVEELHLEDKPFARGWNGYIVKGVYRNIPIAVKLAPLHSERGEALQNEAHVDLELKELWGIYVPTLVMWGTTANRYVVFIVTKFIEGDELETKSMPWTVVLGAIHALRAVHALGVLHRDIQASNFMVCLNGDVLPLDFGFSRRSIRESDFALEMKELQNLLGWKSKGAAVLRLLRDACPLILAGIC